MCSRFGQCGPALPLVFAFAVAVADVARFVALTKEYLGAAFASVDFGGQRLDYEGGILKNTSYALVTVYVHK